jgi:deoxyribonuclease-4
MPLLGYHVSTSGGLKNAFKNAADLEAEAIQIFVSSPQQWNTAQPTMEAAEEFKKARKASKVQKVLVHAAYLPNLSSPKATLRNVSKMKMKDEMMAAFAIGADGYNFHPGSNPDIKEGTANLVDNLNRLAELSEKSCPIKIIIENDAGAGSRVGDTIEELAAIWKGLKDKKRFGFTLDTCHLFVSGYDIRDKKVVDDIVKDFDKLIGLKHLEWIHANDSKGDLGSKKDRHDNIGKGFLGEDTFKTLLNHPKLKHLPFILETPRTGDVKEDIKDIKVMRKLLK